MAATPQFDLGKERGASKQRLRRAILDAAAHILAEGGADALAARGLSAAVGASTKVIYSHFGGMEGVIAGVYADAFARLTAQLDEAAVGASAPAEALAAVARAYRQFALENRDLFELMYGAKARSLAPEPADRMSAAPSIEIIARLVRAGQDAGAFRPGSPRDQAYRFWATIHGPVVLEVTSWLDRDPQTVFDDVLAAALAALA